jgi:hypothetical protein
MRLALSATHRGLVASRAKNPAAGDQIGQRETRIPGLSSILFLDGGFRHLSVLSLPRVGHTPTMITQESSSFVRRQYGSEKPVFDSIASVRISDLLRPKSMGERVKANVVQPVQEPIPDYEAMNRLVSSPDSVRSVNHERDTDR